MLRYNLHHSLQKHLLHQVEEGVFPGVAWSVGDTSQNFSEGCEGWATLVPNREPLGVDTLFDLASLTKPLATALLAVVLEERGELDLRISLRSFLPEAAESAYAQVNLIDLGAHNARLPAWEPMWVAPEPVKGVVQRILVLPPSLGMDQPLYSDLGYILLGAVLEKVSGKSLDQLFLDEIAQPLGLLDIGFPGVAGTGICPAGLRREQLASSAATEVGNRFEQSLAGEKCEGGTLRTALIRGEVHDGNSWAAGGVTGHAGLFGTAHAVVAICREILEPAGQVLGPAGRRRLIEPVAGDRSFGMVLARGSSAAAGVLPDEAVGHTGFTGTSFWLDPDSARYWVLLTNRVHPTVATADFQPVRREFHRLSQGPVPE